MRFRSALLGFGLGVAGCYSSPDGRDEFGGGDTSLGESAGEVGDSTSSGVADSTGEVDPTSTGASGATSLTTATTTGVADDTTGDELTGVADDTTGGDDTTTGGPPDDCPRVRVLTPGDVLNVRPTPSTAMDPVGTLGNGAIVDVLAVVQGEVLDGNGTWYEIKGPNVQGYVWGGLVECTTDEPFDGAFLLPLECGKQATISQGNDGDFSHQGQSFYAFDFSLGLGTPMVAVADGTVLAMYGGTMPGDPCYDGGGMECNNAANYVVLLHGDGTQSIYAHLSEPWVEVDEVVARGTVIGLSGSTGWSTGPHAHVARTEGCGIAWCQSIEMKFADVGGDGIPNTGDVVVSGNCP
jgi:hypothetical protein